MQTKAPLIQDIMGCAKITSEIFALGSGAELSSTLGSGLRQTRRWVGKAEKMVPPIVPLASFLDQHSSPRDPAQAQRKHPPLPPVQESCHTKGQTWVHVAAEEISRSRPRAGLSSTRPQGRLKGKREATCRAGGGDKTEGRGGAPRSFLDQRRHPIVKRLACGTGDRGKSFWLRLSRRNC